MRLARGCALRERELLQQMLHLPIRLHRAQTPMLVPEMPLGDDFKLRSDDAGGKGRARLQGCRRDQGVLDEREREPCRGKSNNRTTMKHDQENKDTAAPCQALAPLACSADSEPEECIAQAMYLLQLCQQDINIGRKSTVWPRAKRAREACQALEDMFSPNSKDV